MECEAVGWGALEVGLALREVQNSQVEKKEKTDSLGERCLLEKGMEE